MSNFYADEPLTKFYANCDLSFSLDKICNLLQKNVVCRQLIMANLQGFFQEFNGSKETRQFKTKYYLSKFPWGHQVNSFHFALDPDPFEDTLF